MKAEYEFTRRKACASQSTAYLSSPSHLLFLISIFLCLWGTSGTRPWSLLAMLACTSAAFIALLWRRKPDLSIFTKREISRNPFLISGLSILAVTIVQFLNPDAIVYEYMGHQTVQNMAHVSFLPSGIIRDWGYNDTFYTLLGLLATWYFALVSWTLLKEINFANLTLRFFAANGFLMAIFAVVQKCLGLKSMYGIIPSELAFYGSFFHQNSAGYMLILACSANLACTYLALRSRKIAQGIIWGIMSVSCALSATFSGSAGVVLSVFLFAVFLCTSIIYIFLKRLLGPIKSLIATLILFTIATSSTAFIFQRQISDRINFELTNVNASLAPRIRLNEYTLELFKENPIFGIGGGTYAIRVQAMLVNSGKLQTLGQVRKISNAAHNDPFQYLCEYGLLGAAFIAYAVVLWISAIFRRRTWLTYGNFLIILGLAIVGASSIVDIHLHIPAIMCAFVLLISLSVSNLCKQI